MKLALIGNCQVVPIRQVIEAVRPEIECVHYEVWRMSLADCDAAGAVLEGYDAIVSQPLGDGRYGRLGAETLRAEHGRVRKLHFIHNLHFEATIPDCTYIGRLGGRVSSPLSNYHSSIVVESFRAGHTERLARDRVLAGARLDMAAIWRRNVEEFRRREAKVDIAFADELEELIRRRNCFHVFNHPQLFLTERYVEKILTTVLGISQDRIDSGIEDELAVHGGWAVHEWAAEALGLGYSQPHFLTPKSQAPMSVEEFVAQSYAIYGRTPEDQLI